MMRKFMLVLTALVIVIMSTMAFISREPYAAVEDAEKEFLFRRLEDWWRAYMEIFMEDPLSADIGIERLRKMKEVDRRYLVPLGPKALPYMMVVKQANQWIGEAITMISKFALHNIVLRVEPGNLLSTTEEFPEVIEKDIIYNHAKVILHWWLKGEKRTPQWFAERYGKWLAAKKEGQTNEAKEAEEWLDLLKEPWKRGRHKLTAYQKLLDIGIAAIPLWLEKLKTEEDPSIREGIMYALSALTDGEVKPTMSTQECLNWWQANKERWTIPFPKSKRDFLNWLEREGWEEPRLSIPVVLTISRLEDEAAIDALLRFLRHPSPFVRAVALEQIQKLFGEQLPKEYALGVGTDKWESYGDLVELGKDNLVRERIRETQERVKDLKEAEKVAEELSDWWARNRGKLTIHWHRAWENLR